MLHGVCLSLSFGVLLATMPIVVIGFREIFSDASPGAKRRLQTAPDQVRLEGPRYCWCSFPIKSRARACPGWSKIPFLLSVSVPDWVCLGQSGLLLARIGIGTPPACIIWYLQCPISCGSSLPALAQEHSAESQRRLWAGDASSQIMSLDQRAARIKMWRRGNRLIQL